MKGVKEMGNGKALFEKGKGNGKTNCLSLYPVPLLPGFPIRLFEMLFVSALPSQSAKLRQPAGS